MSQIQFTLSRKQAAMMYELVTAGAAAKARSGAWSDIQHALWRKMMDRLDRRFAIHHFDPFA